jgi:hypothetical protein
MSFLILLIMATPSCGFYGILLTDTTPGFEPTTLWLRVRRLNHSATIPFMLQASDATRELLLLL